MVNAQPGYPIRGVKWHLPEPKEHQFWPLITCLTPRQRCVRLADIATDLMLRHLDIAKQKLAQSIGNGEIAVLTTPGPTAAHPRQQLQPTADRSQRKPSKCLAFSERKQSKRALARRLAYYGTAKPMQTEIDEQSNRHGHWPDTCRTQRQALTVPALPRGILRSYWSYWLQRWSDAQ